LGLSAIIDADFVERLTRLRQWDGSEVPPGLRQRVTREFQRRQLVARQINELESERRKGIRDQTDPQMDRVRRRLRLWGLGPNTAWLLVREIFGWRWIQNRRELASLAGLTPSPDRIGVRLRPNRTESGSGLDRIGDRIGVRTESGSGFVIVSPIEYFL
jgi:transposase